MNIWIPASKNTPTNDGANTTDHNSKMIDNLKCSNQKQLSLEEGRTCEEKYKHM